MSEAQEQNVEQQAEERQEQQRDNEPKIPKHRFDEVSQRAKDAETRLKTLETEQQKREEEQAKNQGEYQTLAEKRQTKIEQLNSRVQELETQIVTDKRYRSFVSAANGTILPEAFDDAFSMLTSDEWSSVNEDDENGVRMLAQGLADRKPYLAAAPRGSGSGGSRQPVFTARTGQARENGKASGVQPFQFKAPPKHWK